MLRHEREPRKIKKAVTLAAAAGVLATLPACAPSPSSQSEIDLQTITPTVISPVAPLQDVMDITTYNIRAKDPNTVALTRQDGLPFPQKEDGSGIPDELALDLADAVEGIPSVIPCVLTGKEKLVPNKRKVVEVDVEVLDSRCVGRTGAVTIAEFPVIPAAGIAKKRIPQTPTNGLPKIA